VWPGVVLALSILLCIGGVITYLVVPETTAEPDNQETSIAPINTDAPLIDRKPLRRPERTIVAKAKPEQPKEEKNPPKVKHIPDAPTKPPSADPPAPIAFTMKRRQKLDEKELLAQLRKFEEVSLGADTPRLLTAAAALQAKNFPYPGPVALGHRFDLVGLQFRVGQDSQLDNGPAKTLEDLSRALRVHIEAAIRAGGRKRPDIDRLRERLLSDRRSEWLKPEAIPALMQLLQASEDIPVRKLLVELLGQINGKEATRALAIRALTDLDSDARRLATIELQKRPQNDSAPLLLEGLRYPWAPVADHAAETITTIGMKQLVPAVVKMLDEPAPTVPIYIQRNGRTVPVIRELVRVNHLGNCVLCHPPSSNRRDLVRGAVPMPGQDPPPPATTPSYYERGGTFVRADATFLRQDFSVSSQSRILGNGTDTSDLTTCFA